LVAVACFLPGQAKDLSAPLVLIKIQTSDFKIVTSSINKYHKLFYYRRCFK